MKLQVKNGVGGRDVEILCVCAFLFEGREVIPADRQTHGEKRSMRKTNRDWTKRRCKTLVLTWLDRHFVWHQDRIVPGDAMDFLLWELSFRAMQIRAWKVNSSCVRHLFCFVFFCFFFVREKRADFWPFYPVSISAGQSKHQCKQSVAKLEREKITASKLTSFKIQFLMEYSGMNDAQRQEGCVKLHQPEQSN